MRGSLLPSQLLQASWTLVQMTATMTALGLNLPLKMRRPGCQPWLRLSWIYRGQTLWGYTAKRGVIGLRHKLVVTSVTPLMLLIGVIIIAAPQTSFVDITVTCLASMPYSA
jgi:hypothetical protein